MVGIDRHVVERLPKMMRCERNGQNRHTCGQADLHQAVHDRSGDKIVPVDAAIHHKGRTALRVVLPRVGKRLGYEGHFKCAQYVDQVDAGCGNEFGETFVGLIQSPQSPFLYDPFCFLSPKTL